MGIYFCNHSSSTRIPGERKSSACTDYAKAQSVRAAQLAMQREQLIAGASTRGLHAQIDLDYGIILGRDRLDYAQIRL